ncbi:MAG TPA: hypothetical protein VF126_18145 [Acidobacteriaceae bacterium]
MTVLSVSQQSGSQQTTGDPVSQQPGSQEPIEKPRSYVAPVLIVTLVLLLALVCQFLLMPGPNSHPEQSLIQVVENKSAGIRIEARLDSNTLLDPSADPLRVRVMNESQQSIESLYLNISAPGFSLDQPQPRDSARPWPCVPPDGKNGKLDSNQGKLATNQYCEFFVSLTPEARSGSYGITATVFWSQSVAGQSPQGRATLALSPITIDRLFGAARWDRLGHALKDLALPVMLAILGAVFTSRQNLAEATRRNTENNLQQKRIEAERVAAERQEVRQLLLTRVMDRSEKYYLPFVSHGRLILTEAKKKPADTNPEKIFYHLLLLRRRMENFRMEKGGIFFEKRGAEQGAGAAWYLFKTGVDTALGEAAMASALKQVKIEWDYFTFLSNRLALAPQWARFQNWHSKPLSSNQAGGSFLQILGVLDAFQAIMAFEADRSLSKHWYDEENQVNFRWEDPDEGGTVLYALASSTDPDAPGYQTVLVDRLKKLYNRQARIKDLP